MLDRIHRILIAALGFWAISVSASVQASGEQIVADPADVATIDAIITAAYDVISGPKGEERDWARERSLFIEDARLMPTSSKAPQGIRVITPEKYWELSHPFFLEKGFYEQEIGRRVDQFGTMAQVFSAYETRYALDDPEPFSRGINSFQLIHDGDRWWIVGIMWQSETKDNPIPEEYLYKND